MRQEIDHARQGLFVGLAGIDLVYLQDGLPSENTKSRTNRYEAFIGGPAANAAITYALLGGSAALVACIGESEPGLLIKKALAEDYGVQVLDPAVGQKTLPNISSVSISAANASRTIWSGQQAFAVDMGAACGGEAMLSGLRGVEALDGADASMAAIHNTMACATFCLFDSNAPEIAPALARLAHNLGKPLVFDMGSWKPDTDLYLSLASEVIASSACIPPAGQGGFIEVAKRHGVPRFAITQGEAPIYWCEDGWTGEVAPPQVQAMDTLGAGDVYHGAYCYFRFHAGLSFREALEAAAAVAAKSVEHFGPREGVRRYIR